MSAPPRLLLPATIAVSKGTCPVTALSLAPHPVVVQVAMAATRAVLLVQSATSAVRSDTLLATAPRVVKAATAVEDTAAVDTVVRT